MKFQFLLRDFLKLLITFFYLYDFFQEKMFVFRVIYDLLFFFVVIIIVLNLIFGVIIDTFADLRSEKQQKETDLKNTCFICGKKIFFYIRGFYSIVITHIYMHVG